MATAGIDSGAKNSKTVILENGRVIARAAVPTGFDPALAAQASFERAIESAGISRTDILNIVGAGSGKSAITIASDTVSDMRAMSKGAFFCFPTARTVIDVGSEEGRVARLDATGRPVDFAVNGQCAAGSGAFIEAMARALETPLEELGPLALTAGNQIPINAQCVIFAESEVIGLIHAKTPINEISKAIHDSMANRIVSIVLRLGIEEDVVMMGGVAYNPGFLAALKREMRIGKVLVPQHPEFTMALGAALIATEK